MRLFAYTAVLVFCCAFGRDKSYRFSFWKHPNVVIPIQRIATCFKSLEQVLCMLYLCCWRYKLWWCASFVTSWTTWTGCVCWEIAGIFFFYLFFAFIHIVFWKKIRGRKFISELFFCHTVCLIMTPNDGAVDAFNFYELMVILFSPTVFHRNHVLLIFANKSSLISLFFIKSLGVCSANY